MAEIVDILLIGWCLLAVGTYILDLILKTQLQSRKPSSKDSPRPQATDLDNFWPNSQSRGSTTYYDQSPAYRHSQDLNSSSYFTSHPSNANSTQHYQQQQYGSTSAYESSYLTANNSHYDGPQSNYQGVGSPYEAGKQDPIGYFNRFEEADVNSRSANALPGSSQFGLSSNSSGTIPTATGFNSDCVEWVNSILYLFYTQPEKYGPIIGENVYRSLNEKLSNITSSSSEHAGLMIEFETLNSELSTRPELTNIRTECESDKSISATCKIYNKRINLTLMIKRLLHKEHATSSSFMGDDPVVRYELVLENLEGKLKSVAMLADKLIVIQFIEKPDTKILLRPISSTAHEPSQTNQLISEDVLVQMILQTLTQVVVDLYFGHDLDFPQFAPKHQHHQSAYSNYKHKINNIFKGSASEIKRSLKHDLFGLHADQAKERKLFVKIINAKNINYNQTVTCLMELDTPKQQAVSSTKQGSNPIWDEHFLFHVNEKSRELTFELWDSLNLGAIEQVEAPATPTSSLKRKQQFGGSKSTATRWNKAELAPASAKFLGFARVALDELRHNPIQKLSLCLQPALNTPPNDLSSSVGGELQLELLFLEHSASGASQSSAAAAAAAPLSGQQPLHKSNSLNSLAYQQGDIVAIDRKLTPSGFVITTTTITKQSPSQQASNKHQTASRNLGQLLVRNQSPAGSSSMATERSFDDMNLDGLSGSNVSALREQQLDRRSEGTGVDSSVGGRLSRSRSRSRSLLRAIKKRFSFSRTRSRSLGGDPAAAGYGASQPSTPAADRLEADYELGTRSRASSDLSTGGFDASGRAKSVPTSRDPCELPTIVINKGRLSDGANAFTFAAPKSQLVIEVFEPSLREEGAADNAKRGIYRYYAIPESAGDKRKWRKRGTKLHLFNQHQFVASHMANSSTCHLCGRLFSRRPGKQGYKCRNCHLLLHKQCHVKVDHNCPYAKRDGLPLEYIDSEPPAGLVDEMMEANRRQQRTPIGDRSEPTLGNMGTSRTDPYHGPRVGSSGRPANLRMGKSISVEVDDR